MLNNFGFVKKGGKFLIFSTGGDVEEEEGLPTSSELFLPVYLEPECLFVVSRYITLIFYNHQLIFPLLLSSSPTSRHDRFNYLCHIFFSLSLFISMIA